MLSHPSWNQRNYKKQKKKNPKVKLKKWDSFRWRSLEFGALNLCPTRNPQSNLDKCSSLCGGDCSLTPDGTARDAKRPQACLLGAAGMSFFILLCESPFYVFCPFIVMSFLPCSIFKMFSFWDALSIDCPDWCETCNLLPSVSALLALQVCDTLHTYKL